LFSKVLTNPHFSWGPWNEHKFTLGVGVVSYFAEKTLYFLCMMIFLQHYMMMVQQLLLLQHLLQQLLH
jgi:hypothetical protein